MKKTVNAVNLCKSKDMLKKNYYISHVLEKTGTNQNLIIFVVLAEKH